MKKFVILFLLLITSTFSTFNTHAAETIIMPEVILAPAPEIVVDTSIKVHTFVPDLSEPDILVAALPSEAELRCLQKNIYYEARGQGTSGMTAVANVTMHRTQDSRYPSTACGVVKQKSRGTCQFSWFCDGKKSGGPSLRQAADVRAWELAGEIALKALTGTLRDIVNGATHFHNTSTNPGWARKLNRTARIGNHIFYR
ncbi:cell wall hydrolase [Xanthomonas phage X1]|nr:cell wall hydrolase [Xanthomonas phage X1]